MNGTSQPSVKYFDPNGDTRLLFNEGKPDEKIFVVSYKTMSLVCDSWDRMLNPNGPFREATQDGPISLPDDDWKGFEILMNIAHLHFNRVPRKINFQQLLSIAVLTEKYGATKIVRPWWREWLKHNKKLVDKPGHEEWLWIAWAFGQDQIFEKLAKKLVLEVGILPVGRITNSAGVVLNANGTRRYFPPGIFESILQVREETLDKLLKVVPNVILGSYQQKTMGDTMCLGSVLTNRACDAMAYGSMIFELQRIGLGPGRRTGREIPWSVTEVADRLQSIKVMAPHGFYKFQGDCFDHTKCSGHEENSIKMFVDVHLSGIPTAVLEQHRRHMQRRREELLGAKINPGRKRKWDETLDEPDEEEAGPTGQGTVAQQDQGVDSESEEANQEGGDDDEDADGGSTEENEGDEVEDGHSQSGDEDGTSENWSGENGENEAHEGDA